MGCFSGRLMSTASDQKLFCKLCSLFCCSFHEFVEEKVISPSYSSAILTPLQLLEFKHLLLFSDLSCVQLFATLCTVACQVPLYSLSHICSNSWPLSWWCHPTISSSVTPFSSSPQCFPASGSFPVSQLFVSGDQIIGYSALTLVLSKNIPGWFPLGLTGLISLQSKGLSRVFSNTAVQKH